MAGGGTFTAADQWPDAYPEVPLSSIELGRKSPFLCLRWKLALDRQSCFLPASQAILINIDFAIAEPLRKQDATG
jgi:hypothetical protein